jgi:hypothetical protein
MKLILANYYFPIFHITLTRFPYRSWQWIFTLSKKAAKEKNQVKIEGQLAGASRSCCPVRGVEMSFKNQIEMEDIGVPMEQVDWDLWFDCGAAKSYSRAFDVHQEIDSTPQLEEDIQEEKIELKPKRGKKRRIEELRDQSDGQHECCIEGCHKPVRNRLRFNLRVLNDFKQDFLECGWNKICPYHYFADLYRHKKRAKKEYIEPYLLE